MRMKETILKVGHHKIWPATDQTGQPQSRTAKVANVIEMDSMVNGNQSDQHNQHS